MSNRNSQQYSSHTFVSKWLRSPLGALVAKPWFDRLTMKMLDRWYFPISRMWAAARASAGSVEKFIAEIGLPATPALKRKAASILREFETRRDQSKQADEKWQDAFFGDGEYSPEQLVGIEQARLDCRHQFNSMRSKFLRLGISQNISALKWQVPTLEEVSTSYEKWLEQPLELSHLPEYLPEVIKSKSFPGTVGTNYWLRFNSLSPLTNDVVTARVYEPNDEKNPPTLIYGHGICVEFDHWRGLIDEVEALVKMGIRVIRPEAPWHGRRTPLDRFGGERFIATSPRGPVDHFCAAILEWAVLIDWSRSSSSGPVALGGTSLGSMTAHLVADRARQWPARLHPDALLLITHSRGVGDAMFRGKLSDTWGIKAATTKLGWSSDMMQRYMALLETHGPTVVAPENIISILGNRDDVTPYNAAIDLLNEWGVPMENRFDWRRGHFSVPLTMIHDHTPLRKFVEILNRQQPNPVGKNVD